MRRCLTIIYRLILAAGVIGLFGWLIYENTIVSGQLFLSKDFCFKSQFISDLYPEVRTGGVEKGGELCFQRVFVEPVYFKVKVSRTFDRARVKIVYQNQSQPVLQLGLMRRKIGLLDWNFKLKPLENKILDSETNNWTNNWQEGTAEFSVGFDYMNDHYLEFMISAPGLTESRREIKIAGIEVELSRPPANWKSFLNDSKDFLLRKLKTFKKS